jgi:uncharacterized protein (TIGR02246 family)
LRRTLLAIGLAAVLLVATGRDLRAQGRETSPLAISQFVERYFAAWNGHDSAALARNYDADGEATDSTGLTVRGRDAIEAAARTAFGDTFKDAEIHFVRIDSRDVAPGIAAIDVRWWIFGATAPHWERKQYGLSAWVAELNRGEWRIVAAHDQLLAAPADPREASPSPSPPPAPSVRSPAPAAPAAPAARIVRPVLPAPPRSPSPSPSPRPSRSPSPLPSASPSPSPSPSASPSPTPAPFASRPGLPPAER